MKRPAAILLCSSLGTSVLAQGTSFAYQGSLHDNGGAANGNYDLQFYLRDALTAGNPIGPTNTIAPLAVSNGQFTVVLDFGAVFEGSLRYMEIGIRTNGSAAAYTTLSPRQQISTTPYAIFAAGASNLSGTLPTAQLSGTVANNQLANSSVTVNAGPGLGGGGTAPLGGTITLNNSGVIAVTGNSDITASTSGGVVTLGDTATDANTASTIVKRNAAGNFSAGSITLSTNLNLPPTTASAGIIYSGGSTLIQSFGTNNFFAGPAAGNLALTGNNNVGFGPNALHADTSGFQNTAAGFNALRANTTGNYNSAFGNLALNFNSSGSQNAAFGNGAMFDNITGSYNTAFGTWALDYNTGGNQNTAVGNSALLNNQASENTAIGYYALSANTSGSQNTAVGVQALFQNTVGVHNTASGYQAMFSNTNGNFNVAHGYQSLYSNLSGANNTAGGDFSLYSNTTGNNNTASGHQTLWANSTGNNNTAFGEVALHNVTNGVNNIALGYQAGYNLTNGSNDIYIGNAGAAFDNNLIRIGIPGIHTNAFIAGTIFGDGGGLTNVTAATVTGLAATNFWQTGGNSGTTTTNGNFIGTTDNQALEFRVNNSPSLRLEPTLPSPNHVGGHLGANGNRAIPGSYGATIGGGGGTNGYDRNEAATFATVAGGLQNQASGAESVVAGGYANVANNQFSAVAGGGGNHANGSYSVIAGGNGNLAVGDTSSILGGGFNAVQSGGAYATLGGGVSNTITGPMSVIAGGTNNLAGGYASMVAGGVGNYAGADFSFAAGSRALATNQGAFVWADSEAAPFGSTISNQFNVRAGGGVRFVTGGAGITLDGQLLLTSATTVASATNFSGGLAGDVTGTQSATMVSTIGGQPASSVAIGASAANAATSADIPGSIVKRDASGTFATTNITLDGSLSLPATTTGAGIIYSAGAPLIHSYGYQNFYAGTGAGNLTTFGHQNAALGVNALHNNFTGDQNTALGSSALYSNIIGSANTAVGEEALFSATNGSNVAVGYRALFSNTSGNGNTALGITALYANSTGGGNVAIGEAALESNGTGYANIALGCQALGRNSLGANNIALGLQAGFYVTNSNNIEIGTGGLPTDANTIRIGTNTVHTNTFISGIYGATAASGVAVYVNSSGQLGTLTSSVRFKENIHDMNDASDALLALRPVTFQYKSEIDPNGTPQFGLVAEEVEKIAPDLVARDDEGRPYTVRYEAVNAMLLNEFLKEHRRVAAQNRKIQDLEQSVAELKELVSNLVVGMNGGPK
jgi:hypothetical protein